MKGTTTLADSDLLHLHEISPSALHAAIRGDRMDFERCLLPVGLLATCSEESGDDALSLARAGGSHDLLARVRDGVVALVGRHLDADAFLARENIVGAIALVVNVLGAHEGADAAVLVVLRQLLPIVRLVVVEVEQVVGGAPLILLPRIEVVPLHVDHLRLTHLRLLHVFKSVDFALESLLSEVGPLVLDVLEFLLTHALIRNGEVLVKSLLLCSDQKQILCR